MPLSSKLKINEIFHSIQGESSWAGHPTVFIRTSGCNLRCDYCDTTYAYFDGRDLAINEILDEVNSYQAKYVCLTGGEPLLQSKAPELVRNLLDFGYLVSIETSGNRDISNIDSRAKIVLDIKTPDSGARDSFLISNLNHLNTLSELKFVICSEADFNWAEEFCARNDLKKKSSVLYSPSFEKVSARWLAEKILSSKTNVRLHLQQHKYIWSPTARGV